MAGQHRHDKAVRLFRFQICNWNFNENLICPRGPTWSNNWGYNHEAYVDTHSADYCSGHLHACTLVVCWTGNCSRLTNQSKCHREPSAWWCHSCGVVTLSASIWWGFVGAGQPHFAVSVCTLVFSQSGNSLCPLQMEDSISSPFWKKSVSQLRVFEIIYKKKVKTSRRISVVIGKTNQGRALYIAINNGGPSKQTQVLHFKITLCCLRLPRCYLVVAKMFWEVYSTSYLMQKWWIIFSQSKMDLESKFVAQTFRTKSILYRD